MYVIGDVHKEIKKYLRLLYELPKDARSIQVGDMDIGLGVGLPRMPERHRFIRGNHDHPDLSREHPNYLGDFGYLEEEGIFYVAGAYSFDRKLRVLGVSWWMEEELAIPELNKAIDLYAQKRPRLVVSHEAPEEAVQTLLGDLFVGESSTVEKSRTRQALQRMLEIHQPEKWVFGHHHRNKTFLLRGTEFTCLDSLAVKEI